MELVEGLPLPDEFRRIVAAVSGHDRIALANRSGGHGNTRRVVCTVSMP